MIFRRATAVRGALAAKSPSISAAIEADIDVAVAGDFHRGDACDGHRFRRPDPPRFSRRLLQQLCQLEGGGHRQLAKIALLRLLDRDRQIDSITRRNMGVKRLLDRLFEVMKHNPKYSGPVLDSGGDAGGRKCSRNWRDRLIEGFDDAVGPREHDAAFHNDQHEGSKGVHIRRRGSGPRLNQASPRTAPTQPLKFSAIRVWAGRFSGSISSARRPRGQP